MPHTSKQFNEAKARDAKVTVIRDSQHTADSDKPDFESDLYLSQKPDVDFVRTVYGGTKALREAGKTHLPKHAEESEEVWNKRLDASVAFNALRRTLGGLVGMVFRKDPILADETPESVAEDMDNVDLAGRDMPTFARHVLESAVLDGHTFVLVDYPPTDGQFRSRSDESQSGVRPYWVHLEKRDVINLRWHKEGGRPVLDLAVYREVVREPVGEFGEAHRERYRVLRPGHQELWERRAPEEKGEGVRFVLIEEFDVSLDYIPLYAIYANRTGLYQSEPPLLDLAYENVAHYQVRSDHRYGLTFAMVPMPFLKGMDNDAFVWGPGQAIVSENEEADAKILESSGAALGESRQELQDIESRMAALGLQMLVRETRAAETAQAKLIDKAESDSALARIARNLQNGLNSVLQAHADFRGAGEGAAVEINRDFHEQMLDAQTLNVLSQMAERGQLTLETLWNVMRTGEVLDEEFDPELEREELRVNGPMQDLVALAEAGRRSPEEEPPLPEEGA